MSCLFNIQAFCQAEYTDLVRDYVKINENSKKIRDSKIKSLVEIYIKGDRLDTLKACEYDPAGNILSEFTRIDTSSGRTGEFILKKYNYIYKEGLLTEKTDVSGENVRKHHITYDETGNISKEVIRQQGKVIFETEYEYDNLSRLIEASSKDAVNSCKISESYSYDSYNNLAKKSTKNECLGSKVKPVNTVYSYKYDNKSRIIEKQATYPNAGYKILTYKYGTNGEVTEQYESAGSDSYESTVYVYDDKANTVQIEKSEVIGDLTRKMTGSVVKDKLGNRTEEKYFDSNGQLIYTIKYFYEYYN